MSRKKLIAALVCAAFLTVGCAGTLVKDAYNADSALVAAYKVAAPLRADLCNPMAPQLSPEICADSLQVLEVHYQLIITFTGLLEEYARTKDEGVLRQIEALMPLVVQAYADLSALIASFGER